MKRQSLESLASRVRTEVADVYDLTTQLERLGFNRQRVKREFGLNTTFELAKELFRVMPKRAWFPLVKSVEFPVFRHFAVFVGMMLSTLGSSSFHWASLVGLFTWSIVFSRLIGQAQADSETKTQRRIVTLAFVSGLLILMLVALFNPLSPKNLSILVLWWSLNLAFWQRTVYWQILLMLGFGAVTLVSPLIAVLTLLVYSLFFRVDLSLPKASTWRYLQENTLGLGLTTAYALGQALLIGQLIKQTQHPWVGLVVLTLIVFASEWLELALKHTLVKHLWSSKNREEYHARLLSSLGFWGQILVVGMFVVLLFLLQLLIPLVGVSFSFALLGIAIGLGSLLLGFDQLVLVAAGFTIAAFLVILGVHFLGVMLGIIAVFLTGMMLLIMRVEAYGASIL